MFVLATISGESASGPVRIRNLSACGALIEGASLPNVGDRVELRRGSGFVCGEVVWCSDGRAGLRFDGRVEVGEWMPGGHAGQQCVDRIVHQVKSDTIPPSAPILPEQDFALAPMQLRKLAREIDALADELADDGTVVAKLAAKLQALDIASQVLRKLAERAG